LLIGKLFVLLPYKKVNKAVAKRWEAAIAKREQEQKI